MTTEKKYHQDGDDLREYTQAEYTQAAIDLAAAQVLDDEKKQAATDKAALLIKLGLTADELKTLLN